MDSQRTWFDLFHAWPEGVPRRGVVVTSQNEAVPFAAFLVSPTLLLLDRPAPDSVGARKVLLPYSQIAAVKITDVVKNSAFDSAGFTAPTPTPAPG